MSTTKHTPGPLETATINAGYYADASAHVAIVGPLPERQIIARVYGHQEKAEADARLYAASPELLAACEDYLATISDANREGWIKRLRAAQNGLRAAVAKAKAE